METRTTGMFKSLAGIISKRTNMKIKFLLILGVELLAISGYSQVNDNIQKQDYLCVETGFLMDNYNSMGIRLFFEYQKDMKGNLAYGISFENSRHFREYGADYIDKYPTNLNLLSFNYYYKLNARKDKIFWLLGMGLGGVHVYRNENNDNDKFGITLNLSLTVNIKISEKIYFESSPTIGLLPNRAYFSTMNYETFNNFYAFSFIPLGVKVKL